MDFPLFDAHTHQIVPADRNSPLIGAVANHELSEITHLCRAPGKGAFHFYGVHPWVLQNLEADKFRACISRLRIEAGKGKIDGVGEVGLDGTANVGGVRIKAQIEALIPQIAVAAEYNLAVSFHCVRAADALLHALRGVQLPERGIHLHDAVMDRSMVRAFTRLPVPVYHSFGERMLASMRRGRVPAWKECPSERWLLETDAETEMSATEAHSQLLRTAELLAENMHLRLREVCEITTRNALHYFGGRPSGDKDCGQNPSA